MNATPSFPPSVAAPVPFNRATVAPSQMEYLEKAFRIGHLAGDGPFSKTVSRALAEQSGSRLCLLTPSCTDALEMSAVLCGVEPEDEVIVPAFTFVSTANAFALFGARPRFADVLPGTLCMDPDSVAELIGPRTRAIVVVHYGGVAAPMDEIGAIAEREGIPVIEDNAHGLFGSVGGRALGSFGALATLSFHETKNLSCGEGGALLVNDPELADRAEILREKGTNRPQFFRRQVDKYTWVDIGSSYLMAEPLAAILLAQIEFGDEIQRRRHAAWSAYAELLGDWAARLGIGLPHIPAAVDHPAHLYWLWMPDRETRSDFIAHMRKHDIHAVFHYQALNASPMGLRFGGREGECPVSEQASDRLVRLPVFSDMTGDEVDRVVEATLAFDGT